MNTPTTDTVHIELDAEKYDLVLQIVTSEIEMALDLGDDPIAYARFRALLIALHPDHPYLDETPNALPTR